MFKVHRFMTTAIVAGALAIGGLTAGGAQAAAPAGQAAIAAVADEVQPTADHIIRPRAQICKNEAWTSGNGRAILRMQEDGNLVLYKDGRAAWAAGTWMRGDCAVFQEDGNFVVYDSSGSPVWASGTWRQGAYLAIQDDGNVVIYNANNRPVWATNTGD
jgi:hypothetical protein